MSIKQFLFFFTFIVLFHTIHGASTTRPYCIMINPAGDAQYAGRELDNHFERGIALQCAQFMKQELEQHLQDIHVILTHDAGQTVMPLAHAQFANRLGIDLFVSIHFYHEKTSRSQLYFYSFSYGNDHLQNTQHIPLARYDTVHRMHHAQTHTIVESCYTTLMNVATMQKTFDIHVPQAFPHAQLIGINAPAFAYEVGLYSNDDWTTYALLLCQALNAYITQQGTPSIS